MWQVFWFLKTGRGPPKEFIFFLAEAISHEKSEISKG
jgi:hypothetical protein